MTTTLQWDRFPTAADPRWRFFGILLVYVVLGVTALGFNRSWAQIAVVSGGCCALDMALHYVFRGRKLLFPLSAAISSMSLCILANYSHGLVYPLIPVFFTIASKYVFTFEGRHVYNPTLFGIFVSLLASQGMITAAPAYQWGGSLAIAVFIVTAAVVLFVGRIQRTPLILSFLGFYFLAAGLRAYITRWHVPPETIFLGALTSPAFYLFTFFMITDPQTSPRRPRDQVIMSFVIVAIDLLLHTRQMLSTFFYAGFAYYTGRLVVLHVAAFWRDRRSVLPRVAFLGRRVAVVGAVGLVGLWGIRGATGHAGTGAVNFRLVELPASQTGFVARPSDVLSKVDPRIANVGKWLLSVGDAAAVGDFDNDGLQDVFLTNSLKHPDDRAALYRNLGGLRFERVPVPALDDLAHRETELGLVTGALWIDYDNDGDKDLLVMVGYGKTRLLRNRLVEDGKFSLEDVSAASGLDEYTISVAANAFDYDHDGILDLLVASPIAPYLTGYDVPTKFNIFKLPPAAYPGDRRALNVMHRTWHSANNGGKSLLYHGLPGGRFAKVDTATMGLDATRWTLAIGTGDFDGDGWTDLYLANDFGPDQLLLNQQGKGFAEVRGRMVGELGRDTYKGMNASIGDLDNNGFPDVYVSNVHEKLQAEGSLLWMNDGHVRDQGADAFADEATARYALNENRFGWGAAFADLDRDGRLDIIQANGHLDDNYDKVSAKCEDYWYWNANIALTGPELHGYADNWADLRGRCIFPNELNRIYLNRGTYFEDVALQVGVDRRGASRAVAVADFDNDGDLDVLVTRMTDTPSLYRNDAGPANWVGLDLDGNGAACNRDALGSTVRLDYDGGRQMREVTAANGLSAQNDRRLLFGLGTHAEDVAVAVRWCGDAGHEEHLRLTPNRYYRIEQARPGTDVSVVTPVDEGRKPVRR